MMALYLVQHGKNLPKDQDPRKGLSEAGMTEVGRIAQVARQYGVHVSVILHSGKWRAAQTAEIFAEYLSPPGGVRAIGGIDPMGDAAAFVSHVDIGKNEMIVGHLPFLERLISSLIISATSPPIFRMQNGGIVCLDHYPESDQVVVRWSLMPQIG